MPYVEGRTIHDADSHVMEMPEKILEFIEAKHVATLKQYLRPRNEDWEAEMEALHQDPDFISHEESQLVLRMNHEALGSFRKKTVRALWTTLALPASWFSRRTL